MTPSAAILRKVGANVRRLRMKQGFSQEALAERADLHRTFIGGVERGERNLSVLTLSYVARALGTTPAILLSGITASAALPDRQRSERARTT